MQKRSLFTFSGEKIFIVLSIFILSFLVFVSIPRYISNSQGCTMMLPDAYIIILGIPWKEFPCTYKGIVWGESFADHIKELKCLFDKGGFCFVNGSCKYLSCKVKKSPNETIVQKNEALIQKFISEGCTSYYDGCNTCNKGKNGFMCTLMACSTIQEPRCLDYNSPKPSNYAGDKDSTVSHDLQN